MATVAKYVTSRGATLYRVQYRTPEGRLTGKRGFKRKADADAFANSVETAKLRGEYVAPALGKTTIGMLGPDWLKRQRAHLKPSTQHLYEVHWRLYVEPRWANTRIAAIRHSDIQAWVAESIQHSANTAKIAHLILSRILADAVTDRMLAANPAANVKLPRQSSRRNIYLTANQLQRLALESGENYSLVLLLGMVGLRWGEATALRVHDVNFLRRRIELTRNAVHVRGEMIVGTLKSGKSRTVALPTEVVDAIATTAKGKGRDDLLWPAPKGGYRRSPLRGEWLDRAVRRCQAADSTFPRVTAHALRHTAASLAISAGANPKVVQRMLGHASAAMTLDVYADLFDSDMDSVAESISQLWQRQITKTL